MTYAIGADFAKASARKYREFESAHLGKTIRIQSMTELERVGIARTCAEGDRRGEEAARSVVVCVVDAAGRRVFTDDQVGEVLSLPTGLIQQIYDEIDNLCGVDPATDAAEVIAVKND